MGKTVATMSTASTLEDIRFQMLLQRLESTNDTDCVEAEQEIIAMGDAALAKLTSMVEKEPRQKDNQLLMRMGGIFLGCILLVSILFASNIVPTAFLTVLLWIGFLLCLSLYSTFRESASMRLQSQMLHALLLFEDTLAILPMMELLRRDTEREKQKLLGSAYHRQIKAAARTKLLHQFEGMDSETRERQISSHREWLYYPFTTLLEFANNADQIAELCDYIVQTDDIKALPYVSMCANWEAATPKEKHVRDVARNCKQHLEDIIERQKLGATLLRSAEAPETTLVRPASNPVETHSELLLRVISENSQPSE